MGREVVVSPVRRSTVLALAVVTVALGFTLVFTPGLYSWPGFRSHYGVRPKSLGHSPLRDLLPLGLAVIVLARGGTLATRAPKRAVPWLMLALCLLVWSFAWLEGRGAGRLSETLIGERFGHSEFVGLALDSDSIRHFAVSYGTRRDGESAIVYGRTKPPGHALVYVIVARLGRLMRVESWGPAIARSLHYYERPTYTAFAVLAVPLFLFAAALPVPLLQITGARLGGATLGGRSGAPR